MFKKKKKKKKEVDVFDYPLDGRCETCNQKKKKLNVFCLEDKQNHEVWVCFNCCKDPLIQLRIIEKIPWQPIYEFQKYSKQFFDQYSQGITRSVHQRSKLFNEIKDSRQQVGKQAFFKIPKGLLKG